MDSINSLRGIKEQVSAGLCVHLTKKGTKKKGKRKIRHSVGTRTQIVNMSLLHVLKRATNVSCRRLLPSASISAVVPTRFFSTGKDKVDVGNSSQNKPVVGVSEKKSKLGSDSTINEGVSNNNGIPGNNVHEDGGKKKNRKLIKQKHNRSIIQKQRGIVEDLEVKQKASGLPWRIVSAAALHRYPVILPEMPKWKEEMSEIQDKIDNQKREMLLKEAAKVSAQFINEENPTVDEILTTLPFKPASRITEADLNNDRRSLERKLDISLYLIVKRNRKDAAWQFPQGKLLDEEKSVRIGAERVLDRAVGKINRWFISNSPIGYHLYPYPPAMQEHRKQFGAKVFFYRSQLIEGTIKLETRLYTDYAWVTRDELVEYFDKDTAELLHAMLPM
jgi:hypothetical protein